MVEEGSDLTAYAGIGDAINAAITEIVRTGSLRKLDRLRGEVSAPVSELMDDLRLDPKRVLRVYKKLGISSIRELRNSLENGSLENAADGVWLSIFVEGWSKRMSFSSTMRIRSVRLLRTFVSRNAKYDSLTPWWTSDAASKPLMSCLYLIETEDFNRVVVQMQRYGGHTPLLESSDIYARFGLTLGISLRIEAAAKQDWGWWIIRTTGSAAHLEKLTVTLGGHGTNPELRPLP